MMNDEYVIYYYLKLLFKHNSYQIVMNNCKFNLFLICQQIISDFHQRKT